MKMESNEHCKLLYIQSILKTCKLFYQNCNNASNV